MKDHPDHNSTKIDTSSQLQTNKTLIGKLRLIGFWIFWPIFSFYAAQYSIAIILYTILGQQKIEVLEGDAVFTSVLQAVIYAVMFVLVVVVPQKLFKKPITLEDLGLQKRLPTWTDIGLGMAGWIAATFLSMILTMIVASLVSFDLSQTQDVGFKDLSQPYQYILAFITLVIAAPVFEELIFRGAMYGELRKVNPWLAALIVSVLFGLAHGQWNVGVTTFAMSLVMCFMREKFTGTIWAGIIMHMVKNGVAFYLLFMVPDLLEMVTS